MFLEASLCSHTFSFMVDILPDFIWDITALSDSDQLSKGCLKVQVREAFICGLLHQCQCCNTGKHHVSHGLGKVLLEGNGVFRWLVARTAWCHVSHPGAEDSSYIPENFSESSWCRVQQWRRAVGCTCDCDFCFPGVHPGLLSLLLPQILVKDQRHQTESKTRKGCLEHLDVFSGALLHRSFCRI